MNKAIELIALAKEYCGKRVIDDLSQEVKEGEIFGFLESMQMKIAFHPRKHSGDFSRS